MAVCKIDQSFQRLSSQSSLSPTNRSSWIFATCVLCREPFENAELRVLVDGQNFHTTCFRCAQCFEELKEGEFYNFESKFYCKYDFHKLFAPVCTKCGNVIEGLVKKALNSSFHPKCFHCQKCYNNLDEGVWYIDGMMMCFNCKSLQPKTPTYRCSQCQQTIDTADLLCRGFDFYHAYHFECYQCKTVLNKNAREYQGALYCSRCFNQKCEVCADCKKIIHPHETRSLIVMEKHYHVDHFRCAHCGQPFRGSQYYERNNKVYCDKDFIKLFGDYCFICQAGLTGRAVRILNKSWCIDCYRCVTCWKPLKHSNQVASLDDKPMCKKCLKQKNYQKVLEIKLKENKDGNNKTASCF